MARGAWRAIVHGVAKSRTLLSDYHTHTLSQTLIHVGPNAGATEQLASLWAATCLSLLP